MRSVLQREFLLNAKLLLLWSFVVGGLGLACILLYQSMEGEVASMADAFSNMGAFSDAFGMSTLSIATLEGYFATEVGVVHGIGSGMFAAMIAIGILSKEEEGHTGEFLLTLPISRSKVVAAKGLCVLICLVGFTTICGLCYVLGFAVLGESISWEYFYEFMGLQLLMNVEVGAICFALSAISGKNRMGLGLGIAMICYVYDLIGRVVPDLREYLWVGPYAYANASEIFSGAKVKVAALWTAGIVIVLGVGLAFFLYERRDLAS